MTRRAKIWWGVLFAIVLLVAAVIIYANHLVSSFADKQLRKQIDKSPNVILTYDDLSVRLFTGIISLDNIECQLLPTDSLLRDKYGQRINVKQIDIRGINWFTIRKKQLDIHDIRIVEPHAEIYIPPKQIEKDLAEVDSTQRKAAFLSQISVGKIKLISGDVSLTRLDNKFSMLAEGIDLGLYDLEYNITDKSYSYNDSVYYLTLTNLNMITSDGLMALKTGKFQTEDAGELYVENLHAYNTCKREQLAKAKGKVPVAWIDAHVKSLTTSKVNLFRQALAKSVDLEKITVKGDKIQLYRDMQYPPKKPYPMPQEAIMQIPIPVNVGTMSLDMPTMAIALTTDGQHVGKMSMSNIRLTATGFTNSKGKTLKAHALCNVGGGKAEINLNLINDRASTFTFNCKGTNMDASQMNDFIHPFSGASIACDIKTLNISSKGNKSNGNGKFCMTYDNLRVHITKEDAPIKRLAQNAGVINVFAPSILIPRNPRPNTTQPFECEVEFKRNTKKNFAAYLMAPLMEGSIHTVLPESFFYTVKKKMQQAEANRK